MEEWLPLKRILMFGTTVNGVTTVDALERRCDNSTPINGWKVVRVSDQVATGHVVLTIRPEHIRRTRATYTALVW